MQFGTGIHEEETHTLRSFMRFLKCAVVGYAVEPAPHSPVRQQVCSTPSLESLLFGAF